MLHSNSCSGAGSQSYVSRTGILGRFSGGGCCLYVDSYGSGLYQKTESAEKYAVADGAFVCGVSVLGFSDRVSGLVFRVRDSGGDSSDISCAYGHCEADEIAGILLYGLLSAGLCRRAFAASVLACGAHADA